MEVINLDLENDIDKSVSVDLNLKSSEPPKINIVKNDTSSNFFSKNTSPNLSVSNRSTSPSKESNIGLDLLMNKKKKTNDNETDVFKSKTISNNESKSIDINPNNINTSFNTSEKKEESLDDLLSDINLDSLDIGSEATKQEQNKSSSDNVFSDDIFSSLETDNFEPKKEEPKVKSFEEIQKEKFDLLCQLERLEERGVKMHKKFSMSSTYEEMKYEFDRVSQSREINQSVKFQRKMLVAFVTAIEFLNGRFDPLDVKLDGWSESIHENINDYDDVFEELHEKYKSKSKMAPELKLLLMLGGSGFMFHLTNTMFKSSLPGMGDIMKQNPDLMQQFAKAAVNTMSDSDETKGLGNLMGDMMDMKSSSNSSERMSHQPPTRKEMKGPPDLDSILEQLDSNNGNNKRVNLDSGSEISDNDIETRNINLGRKRSLTVEDHII